MTPSGPASASTRVEHGAASVLVWVIENLTVSPRSPRLTTGLVAVMLGGALLAGLSVPAFWASQGLLIVLGHVVAPVYYARTVTTEVDSNP